MALSRDVIDGSAVAAVFNSGPLVLLEASA